MLGELLLPIRQHQDELETSLVNLTMVLARAVVYRELTIDSSQIRQVVRRYQYSVHQMVEHHLILWVCSCFFSLTVAPINTHHRILG